MKHQSVEIKERLLFFLLYRMGYHAAFTEMLNADVFAITRAKYTHEFEIKTSKPDLMSELNCVKELVMFGEAKKSYAKNWKHTRYLGITNSVLSIEIPNYFSFVVVPELSKTALEILATTAYGVYEYDGGYIRNLKKATLLNKEKVSEKLFFYLLRKAAVEVQTLREKL